MDNTWTEFFESWIQGKDSPELAEQTLEKLRKALRRELGRRGLWNLPPRFLGNLDSLGARDHHKASLDEMVSAAFEYVFLDHYNYLETRVDAGVAIDGLVVVMVGQFLTARQKESDRPGYLTYDRVNSALGELMDEGKLTRIPAEESPCGQPMYCFDEAGGAFNKSAEDDVATWTGELMPGLVDGQGRQRAKTIQQLKTRILSLQGRGVGRLTLQDLLRPLRREARHWWGTVTQDELAKTTVSEHSRQCNLLVLDLEKAIQQAPWDPATRHDAHRLLKYLRGCIEEEGESPSMRQMAKDLGLSRRRIAELLRLLQNC